jgi:DNA polymerase ligase (LigD)-like protein
LDYHLCMPRFVVLLHETPPGYPRGNHLDLMLEHQGVLWTWALETPPMPGETVTAERLPDHRLDYLDYEGAVSQDRGVVSRIDSGHYEMLQQTVTMVSVLLQGAKIRGTLILSSEDDARQRWRCSLSAG